MTFSPYVAHYPFSALLKVRNLRLKTKIMRVRLFCMNVNKNHKTLPTHQSNTQYYIYTLLQSCVLLKSRNVAIRVKVMLKKRNFQQNCSHVTFSTT